MEYSCHLGTGEKNKITITADIGRLSEQKITELVEEAEVYAEQDRIIREKVESRNKLEGYVYQMKNSIEDQDKAGGKISMEDKEIISKGKIPGMGCNLVCMMRCSWNDVLL